MDDDQLDDLKQFIQATVSQSEERLRDDLTTEMRAGFAGAGDALEPIHTELANHETRISALEEGAQAA